MNEFRSILLEETRILLVIPEKLLKQSNRLTFLLSYLESLPYLPHWAQCRQE